MKIYSYKGSSNISGRRIKTSRRRLGLSQAELAVKLQVEGVCLEQKSISRIECGSRCVTDYELLAFASVLKTTVQWLLTGE
ncbi:MAG: helix-turn-helix transcriptional regulator [Oscillospiraceae bacterium]|nr:helix-turn-helix transcriptional regulator [Oscillospiraceae bacterium]